MGSSKSSDLVWLDSSTSKAPSDSSRQRREIMQKVALRRKREPKQHHPNSRQLPVFVHDDTSESSKGGLHGQGGGSQPTNPEPTPFGPSDLELRPRVMPFLVTIMHPSVLVKCNLDFADLASLASLEVGRYTGQSILAHSRSIACFLGDCVVARVRCLLTPGDAGWESLAISSYSEALSNLQDAINLSRERPTAEVLCATQILGLYELLNPSRENAWMNHAAGAASIIKLQGPGSYRSDFEKSLFMSHVGPIITEAILENESCFLDHPAWTSVLRSIITDDPLVPERSTMLISLVILLVQIPGLFRDFTRIICNPLVPLLPTAMIYITRAQNIRLALKDWYRRYYAGSNDAAIIETGLGDGYCKLLILFYLCSIYANRLNTCIHWAGTPNIEEMEEESQLFSKAILSFCEGEAHSNLQSSLVLAQKLPIAKATIESGEEWRQQLRDIGQFQLFIMPEQTFRHWCSLFGRKTS